MATIFFFFYSRRKRDASQYEFKPEDVIVLHITALEGQQTEIELLLLDPASTSPLPDSSFTTKELQSLIVKIDKTKLPFQVKSVDGVSVKWVVAKWLVALFEKHDTNFTAKNATDLLHVLVTLNSCKLSTTCQLHRIARSALKSRLLQLVIAKLITTCGNKLQQAYVWITSF